MVLTLSGLAALVLGIGMAVDANIITYERIKDELRNGRSLRSAVLSRQQAGDADDPRLEFHDLHRGRRHVLVWRGRYPRLRCGLDDQHYHRVLTAVLLSRFMLTDVRQSNVVKRPWWFGARKGWWSNQKQRFDIVRRRSWFLALLSGAITVAGLIVFVLFGFNLGTDFKAGSRVQLQLNDPVNVNSGPCNA